MSLFCPMNMWMIRAGKTRGEGVYWTLTTWSTKANVYHFATRADALRYTPKEGEWRLVRALPAGTMRARRMATARELRAMAKRLLKAHRATAQEDWHDMTVATELEARAAELENER